jgi:hypothetical protein
MVPVLAMIGLALLAVGLALCAYAVRKHGTEVERQRSRAGGGGWGRIWKSRRRFETDVGHRLYVIGLELIALAAFIAVVIAWNL